MGDPCRFLNPLRRDGTSQHQRLLKALRPSYVKVDERSLSDLLIYARDYAKLLRYYTVNNSPGGDWVEFIEQDVSVLVAIIAHTDADQIRDEFNSKKDAILAASPIERAAAFSAAMDCFFDTAKMFDGWYRSSIKGLALREALKRLIGSVLNAPLRDAIGYSQRAEQLNLLTAVEAADFSKAWNLSGVAPDVSLFPSGVPIPKKEMDDAADRLAAAFDRFHEALVFLVKDADKRYLQQTLDSYPQHLPHMALFLAFLNIFKVAQRHLNTITAQHLDFYYREVLGLQRLPEKPDQVHLVFELAKTFSSHAVKKDTALKAGKDAKGAELFYGADAELVVNRAALDEKHGLKTVFVDMDARGVVENVYAAADADSADGKGAKIEDPEGKWKTFGGVEMPFAEIGFAVASPMFLLAEGTREIAVVFRLKRAPGFFGATGAQACRELKRNVKAAASGEKEWLDVAVERVDVWDGSKLWTSAAQPSGDKPTGKPYVKYVLELDSTADPVTAFDAKKLEGGFATKWPVIKFVLDNEGLTAAALEITKSGRIAEYSNQKPSYALGELVKHRRKIYSARRAIDVAGLSPADNALLWNPLKPSYPYKYFQSMELTGLEIELDVDGMRSLLLESDVGLLDPAKPFHPFGPVPRAGGSFLIGSHEVFQKAVTRLDLAVQWADLPTENLAVHYDAYRRPKKTGQTTGDPIVTGNEYFTADISVLKGGKWGKPVHSDVPLFKSKKAKTPVPLPSPPGEPPKPPPDPVRDFQISTGSNLVPRDSKLKEFDRFDTSLRQGFLRLALDYSFLHSMYPSVLAAAAKAGTVVNPPYTPLMASLVLDYEASLKTDYTQNIRDDYKNRVEQIFQIGPFGQREIYPIGDDPNAVGVPIERKLVPQFTVTVKDSSGVARAATAEGTLYIGIDKLEPPQNLSLLFQVAEGSEDPTLPVQEIVWSYLADGVWADFESTEIVSDATNGLLTSGVVKLSVPRKASKKNTLLPSGLHWLKASAAVNSAAVPQLIAVRPQAVAASFRNNKNDPAHLSKPLAAGSISKLKSREAAIKSIEQPYASFGGRMKESDEAFYVRVSERLRHKQRAVTIFDYERLTLQEFPEVYKVKCVNHTVGRREYAPGSVRLAVVPNLRNKNAVDPFKPRLSLNKREEIRKYLSQFASDFVAVEVANPLYEEVQVRFNVRFQAGLDKGYYTTKLEQDIIRFLSPWLYDDAAELSFGGRVHRSSILNYVDERDYVDFVTDFEMDHIVDGVVDKDVEEAVASSSSSAVVSAKTHRIGHDTKSCEDPPSTTGRLRLQVKGARQGK